jgi:preprotein translocase subunit SecA
MFAAMMDGIKEEAVGFLFNLEVQVEQEPEAPQLSVADGLRSPVGRPAGGEQQAEQQAPQIRAKGLDRPAPPANLAYSAPTVDGEAEVVAQVTTDDDEYAGVGRNVKCPCGSGKKYKQCHGAPGGPTGMTTRVNG